MTVLVVLDSHREDLKFLQNQPANIVVDFCKLASCFLNKGCNAKLYHAASQKLQIDVKQIQTCVEGLAYLYVEAGKSNLNKDEFKEAVLNLGLPENFYKLIYEEYLSQKHVLDNALPQVGIQHFQYRNLEWRFQVQVSSRAMLKQNQPNVIIKLELEKAGKVKKVCLQSDISNIVHMSQLLNQALQDSKTNHSKRIHRAIA